MKTLAVLSMAFVASQAFFLPNDFFTDIANRMTDLHHAVRPQGLHSQRPHPPLLPDANNDATHQRMSDLFNSLTPEEQAALKNHLFGQKFPRPLPASHHGHHQFSDEQIEAARAKWNSMTPEQQQAFREKHEKPRHFADSDSSESVSSESSSSEEIRVRRPRSIQGIRPLPELEAPVVRPAHHKNGHQNNGDEKIKAIRDRWESMTPEEREAVKNGRRKHYKADEVPLARPLPQFPDQPLVRSPRSFQAIQPLPQFNDQPLVRSPRSFQAIQPLPEYIDSPPMVRNPRSIQAIQPLPEFIDYVPMVRNPRSIQAIQPLPEFAQIEPASNQGPLNPGDFRRPAFPDNQGPLNPGDHRRPTYPGGNQRPNFPQDNMKPNPRPLIGRPEFMPIRPFNVALNPESDYAPMLEKMKGMTEEEKVKYIREIFPEGMPIRPIDNVVDPEYSRPVNPLIPIEPAAHQDEMKFQPIRPYLFPIATRPLLPLEFQPIFPIPAVSDPEDVNFIAHFPISLKNGGEEEEAEDEDDEDKEPEFMPY